MVRRTSRIPVADLDVLYRCATALTFPSLYEGFGLPVLEAMSRGCPVIAADATTLPEVVNGAGLLVPPDDPERWSQAMGRVLEDEGCRDELIEAGRAHGAPRVARRGPGVGHGLPAAPQLMRITVLCPHFAPDVAPTGEVMTSIALEVTAPRPRAAHRHGRPGTSTTTSRSAGMASSSGTRRRRGG